MNSLSPAYLEGLHLSGEQRGMLDALEKHRARLAALVPPGAASLDALAAEALADSCESSNRIEGIAVPRERIEAIVSRGARPSGRAEGEIAGYRDALRLVHESSSLMDFTVNIIIQLHAMLHRHTGHGGGRWKNTDNRIEERNPDGSLRRVRFEPVSARETPLAMERLTASYGEAVRAGRHPMLLAPCAVFDFLAVHPFTDGNGRVSRLLTLMLLRRMGHDVCRYVSLERIIEGTREQYYGSLEASSPGWHEGAHDILPWASYCWRTLERCYSELSARLDLSP